MAFLKQNNKRAEESRGSFGPLTKGDYEVLVTKGKWNTPAGKTPHAEFELTVRSDVEQEFKGRKVFDRFFISQDPEKVEVSMGFIERFNLALGVPDGVEFDTPEQWVDYVVGKPVKAHIDKQKDNDQYNEVRWYNPSEFKKVTEQPAPAGQLPPTVQTSQDPFNNPNGQIDISDDDLPF